MTELSDQELIEQFLDEGNKQAFEQLVKRHIKKVRNFMIRMSVQEKDADDLTQEVFIKVYRFLPEFRSDAKFSTWLFRISANTAKSFFRKKGWQALAPDENIDFICQSHSRVKSDQLLAQELDEHIGHAIQQLPAPMRSALVLTVMEDVPYAEAAKIENCSMTTLYWRIHKGRQQLKQILKEYLDE